VRLGGDEMQDESGAKRRCRIFLPAPHCTAAAPRAGRVSARACCLVVACLLSAKVSGFFDVDITVLVAFGATHKSY
jgi:hypothetical protein